MSPVREPYQALRKKDGHFLYYRTWPVEQPRASLLLIHGLGGYSGRFFELAPFFNQLGFHVEAFDLQGFGVSDECKGHIDHFSTYRKDIALFLEKIQETVPGKEPFIYAESMGALITLDFLIHHPNAVRGALLTSPALKDNLPLSLGERTLIGCSAFLKPKRTFSTHFTADQFTRDAVMAKRVETDELEVRQVTAKLMYETLKTMLFVNLNAKKIKTPLLIQQAELDYLISAKASEAFYNRLPGPDKLFILYKGFYHALYLDQGRNQVFQDMANWLEKHLCDPLRRGY